MSIACPYCHEEFPDAAGLQEHAEELIEQAVREEFGVPAPEPQGGNPVNRYRKAIVATVVGVLAVLDHLYGPGNTASQIVLSVAGALGVYQATNEA